MLADHNLSDPLVYVRAVHFAATLLVAGIAFFLVFIAEPAFRRAGNDTRLATAVRRRLTLLAWIGLLLTVISGAAWLILTAAAMSQQPLPGVFSGGVLWTVLSDTTFGNDWLMRAVLACLLAGLLAPALSKQRITSRLIKSALVILAAGLAGSLAWAGHAAGGIGMEATLHPAADVLHLIAAAAWVGALVPLTLLLSTVTPEATSLAIARTATLRFSALGIASVATLLASGLINTWYLVGSVTALVGTDYGRLLLAKIAVFLFMVAIAAFNLLRLTPRIAKIANVPAAQQALRQLRRNAAIEAIAGAIVLAIVGALGTLPPAIHAAHHHPAYGAPPADAAFQHIHTEQGMADVTITPGRVGTARATIRLWTEDFEALEAQAVTFTLTPPAAGSKPTTHLASQDSDGAWQVDGIELSQPGNWTVTVDAVLGPAKHLLLAAPIVIEGK
jgi:putative copper resistance protein D